MAAAHPNLHSGAMTDPSGDDAMRDVVPRCLGCGYIVWGLSEDRCPECGQPIDWEVVLEAARFPRLPLERAVGWGRLRAGLRTWLLVVRHPRSVARCLSERSSVWLATLFAVFCIAIGVGGFLLVGRERMGAQDVTGWVIGTWLHIELQSLVFLLADFRRGGWVRQWSVWRLVSLYTTAFVVFDVIGGPPMMEEYVGKANFPWLLSNEVWRLSTWWPVRNIDVADLARGVAYYWWMVALSLMLWTRLRRKWALLIILALMPVVTMGSCRLAYHITELYW